MQTAMDCFAKRQKVRGTFHSSFLAVPRKPGKPGFNNVWLDIAVQNMQEK
jgi:hypothetical protein